MKLEYYDMQKNDGFIIPDARKNRAFGISRLHGSVLLFRELNEGEVPESCRALCVVVDPLYYTQFHWEDNRMFVYADHFDCAQFVVAYDAGDTIAVKIPRKSIPNHVRTYYYIPLDGEEGAR